jgi:AraC-like DNA-binding protein
VVEAFGGPALGPPRYDPRIAQVLEILKAAMPEAPSAQQLGERVGLSEGRLIHLFSEQVGVPLRRYVLWLRIRHVVFCLALQRNLTDAAHEAGFADSAHLTRVFRSMFGMAPSHILRADQVSLALEIPELPLTGPHAIQDRARLEQVMAKFADRLTR